MDKVTNDDRVDLAVAVILWTGYGWASFPLRKDSSLGSIFQAEETERLLVLVKSLEADFYRSQSFMTAFDRHEMSEIATTEFRILHPSLPNIISEAFAWCYTFDYR